MTSAPTSTATEHDTTRPTTRRRHVIYWLVSLPVLAETAAGIQWDYARNPTVVEALATIQFPDYMADVLGTAKVLALIALLVPGFPRLKEWAYAGLGLPPFPGHVVHAARTGSRGVSSNCRGLSMCRAECRRRLL